MYMKKNDTNESKEFKEIWDDFYRYKGICIDFLMFQEEILKHINNGDKFCFFIGSGASVSSGMPSGRQMVNEWYDYLKKDKDSRTFKEDIDNRIKRIIEIKKDCNKNDLKSKLKKYSCIDYIPNISGSQDDYNYIYELRFAYDEDEGKRYFLKKADEAYPNTGYMALSSIICNGNNNVVITTNFDELIDISTFIYQNKKILSIEHESLAEYALNEWNDRPRILKLHQGVALGGLNKAEETKELKKEWEKVLNILFSEYIPIFIGYSGTDRDIMDFLNKKRFRKIYWCYRYGSVVNSNVKDLVMKNGNLVTIFDSDQFFVDMKDVFLNKELSYLDKDDIYDPSRRAMKNRGELKRSKKIVTNSLNIYDEKTKTLLRNIYSENEPRLGWGSLILFFIALIAWDRKMMKKMIYKTEDEFYPRGYYILGKRCRDKRDIQSACELFRDVIENDQSDKFFKVEALKKLYEIFKENGREKELRECDLHTLKMLPYDHQSFELINELYQSFYT